MAPVRPSEEELGRKWDRCFVDTTFKAVGGAVFGGVVSLLFFKRSAWPVTLGLGVGLGAGYSNCRHQFFWHGPRGPLFGRPPWGGGRELWAGYGKDGKFKHPPCHEDWKHSKQEDSTAVQPAESQSEPKQDDKPSES